MERVLTVRTLNGRDEKITVNDSLDFVGFTEQLRSTFGFDSDRLVKVIYSGKVVNQNDFTNIPDKSVVVCMATRQPRSEPNVNLVNNEEAKANVNTSDNTVQSQTFNSNSNTNSNTNSNSNPNPSTDSEKYGFLNIKAYTVVFLNFISSNPQLRDAFLNNYGSLATEIVKSPQLESVMKSILSQSSDIAKSMVSGENIKVNINMDKDSPGLEKIELNEQDERNIDQLITLGFNPDKVIVEYLKADKDLSKALQNLQL